MCARAGAQGITFGGSVSSGAAGRTTGEDNIGDGDVMLNCVSRSISFPEYATGATRTLGGELASPVQR